MCFLSLLYQTIADYPVVAAANRDEFLDRPGLVPRQIVAGVWGGVDPRAGGTWLGVNDVGVLVAVANLHVNTAPLADARSRGLLCLDLLSARRRDGLDELLRRRFDDGRYNPFNLLSAGGDRAWVATWDGERLVIDELSAGLHVIGNSPPDAADDPKVARGRELIGNPPDVDAAEEVLRTACRDHGARDDRADAICVHLAESGTLSSSIVALHATDPADDRYRFADGPPCGTEYEDVSAMLRRKS